VHDVSFTIVTGVSGAGKTQAMKVLEDLGFFCIDNLPPSLLPQLVELHFQTGQNRKYAIAIDIRVREYFSDLQKALAWLDQKGYRYFLLFLDCSDAVLVRRFSETRRLHPLHQSLDTAESIEGTIAAERRLLADVRSIADVIIDTTDLRPMDLRQRLLDIYEGKPLHKSVTVDVFSFGYKFGAPIDADMVFDVRFIPNPYYVDKLRPLTGADQGVFDYVMQFPITEVFLSRVSDLIVNLIPGYAREGKARLTVGIGCTGGQHRSVAVAIALHRRLQDLDVAASLRHRERSAAPTL